MLRAFEPTDLSAAVALLYQCGLGNPPNKPEQDLERIIAATESRIFVSEAEKGGLNGVVVAANEGRRGWIYYLAVLPSARHQRLGEALVRHAENWLMERGVPKVLLLIRNDNLDVMAFYHQLGYQEEACTCMGRWLDTPHAT